MAEEKNQQTDAPKTTESNVVAEDKTQVEDATVVQSLEAIALEQSEEKPNKVVKGEFVAASGNDLYAAASTLLDIAAELRRPHTNIDLAKLRQSLTAEINAFNLKAKNKGIAETQITLARYILCATLDEFVLDTPWGANSNWSEYSLLNTFHQDSSGGAKFFEILDKMKQEPSTNLSILEIIYTCLALGYLGKYRITHGGSEQVTAIKASLYRQIKTQRGEMVDSYISRAELLKASKVNKIKRVPVLRLVIIAAIALVIIYSIFKIFISRDANKTMDNYRNIVVESTFNQDGNRATE